MLQNILLFSPLITFLPFGFKLSLVDVQTHRLPNIMQAQCLVSVCVCQLIVSVFRRDFSQMFKSTQVSVFMLGIFAILYFCSRGQLGMGDVKYAFVLGQVIGWTNPDLWIFSIWLSFALATIWSIGKYVRSDLQMNRRIAFGPFLTIATVGCCLWIMF